MIGRSDSDPIKIATNGSLIDQISSLKMRNGEITVDLILMQASF